MTGTRGVNSWSFLFGKWKGESVNDAGRLGNADVSLHGDCSRMGVLDGYLYGAIILYCLGWIVISGLDWIQRGMGGW